MKYEIMTLFPELFSPMLESSIIGRAHEKGIVESHVTNIRDFSTNKHKKVDETPFGGGAGMIMGPQPVFDALNAIGTKPGRLIYMSPRGRVIDRDYLDELREEERIVILCGHYEGVDQRILDAYNFEEVSVGDYVLTGGEIAAMILIDALTRLLPGVLGSADSHNEESVYSGLLEYPQYTRPADFEGLVVPEVLTCGNHREIAKYNFANALLLTRERRPDLYEKFIMDHPGGSGLSKDEREILAHMSDF